MKHSKAAWKPEADLIVRPRKKSLIYKMQLLRVAMAADSNKVVLVWTKWPAKFVTDLRAASDLSCFMIKRPNNFYYLCKTFAQCLLKQKSESPEMTAEQKTLNLK